MAASTSLERASFFGSAAGGDATQTANTFRIRNIRNMGSFQKKEGGPCRYCTDRHKRRPPLGSKVSTPTRRASEELLISEGTILKEHVRAARVCCASRETSRCSRRPG